MDGNGRWGKKEKEEIRSFKRSRDSKKIVKGSIKLKIPVLTFYVFSSENWKRPKGEIYFLFKLIDNYFLKEIDNFFSQGIRINIIGEINRLKLNVKKTLIESMKLTKKNKKIIVNLAINYGSKNEILNASKRTKKLNLKNFENNLYTTSTPHPDILIELVDIQD